MKKTWTAFRLCPWYNLKSGGLNVHPTCSLFYIIWLIASAECSRCFELSVTRVALDPNTPTAGLLSKIKQSEASALISAISSEASYSFEQVSNPESSLYKIQSITSKALSICFSLCLSQSTYMSLPVCLSVRLSAGCLSDLSVHGCLLGQSTECTIS